MRFGRGESGEDTEQLQSCSKGCASRRHASICLATVPETSVRRKRRPWNLIGQAFVVDAEVVQDGRLHVVHVDRDRSTML